MSTRGLDDLVCGPGSSNPTDLICAYDKSHQIRRARYLRHVHKCRMNYVKKHAYDIQILVCPYNYEHHIPSAEFDDHFKNCPDQYDMIRFKAAYSKPHTYDGNGAARPKEGDQKQDYSWEPKPPPNKEDLTKAMKSLQLSKNKERRPYIVLERKSERKTKKSND